MAAVTSLGATFDTNSGTHTVTATPAVKDLIVIIVANTGSTSSVAPTDNNSDGAGTYTLIQSSVKATSADTMRIYVRNALVGSGTSTVFTQAPGTTTGGGLFVLKITGVAKFGISAVLQSAFQSNIASGNTPAPVFSAVPLSTSSIITAVFNATSPAGTTVRSGYASLSNLGYSNPTTGLRDASLNSGETSATITWGGTSASAFCSIAIEVDGTNTLTSSGGIPTVLIPGNWLVFSMGATDDLPIPPVAFQPDEDFWFNPTPPAVGYLYQSFPFTDKDEIPVGFLTATVDEYFWDSRLYLYKQYIPSVQAMFSADDDSYPTFPVVTFQPDEDFWQNPVAPVTGRLYVQLPYWFDSNEIASGHGQFDEDFWVNPSIPCVQTNLYQFLPIGIDEQTPQLHGQFDEDFWVNPAYKCYILNSTPIQWQFDQNEVLFAASITGFAIDIFSFFDITTVAFIAAQFSQLPDTILLDMASDPTYPVPYQRGCIQVLLFRRFNGRNAFEYVTPQQAALRTASINALFNLRSATNPLFALLLIQEEANFNMFGI